MRKLIKTFSVMLFALFSSFASAIIVPNNTYAAEVFNVTDATIKNASTGTTATVDGINGNEVTSSVKFLNVNDSVTFSIKIKNNSGQKVRLISVTDNNDKDILAYEYNAAPNYVFDADSEYEFTPKVTYLQSVTTWTEHEQSISVKFTFTYETVTETSNSRTVGATPDSTPKTSDVTLGTNPKTNDNIPGFIAILGLSIVGLIIAIVLFKRGKNKAKTLVVIAAIVAVSGVAVRGVFADGNSFDVELVINYTFDNINHITYEGLTTSEESFVHNPDAYIPGEREISINNPLSRSQYNFAGWTGSNGNTPTKQLVIPTTATGDLHYIANWTPIGYPITLHLDGGTLEQMPPETYTYESPDIQIGVPTRPGFVFMGWSGTNIPNVTMAYKILHNSSGALEFTANWSPISYNVYYAGLDNEGSDNYITGSIDPHLNIGYNEEFTLRDNGFTLNHPDNNYRFAGYHLRDVHLNQSLGDYQPGDTLKNLNSEYNGVVEVTPIWEYLGPKLKVGDIVNYRPNVSDANGTAFSTPYSYTAITTLTGASSNQTFSSNNNMSQWRVLEIADDGTVTLIGNTTSNLQLKGFTGFYGASDVLEGAASVYGHGFGAVSARSLNIGDFVRNITNPSALKNITQYGQPRNTNYSFARTLPTERSTSVDANGFTHVDYGALTSVEAQTTFAITVTRLSNYGGTRGNMKNENAYTVLFSGGWGSVGAWINHRGVDPISQQAEYGLQIVQSNNILHKSLRSVGVSPRDTAQSFRVAPVVTMRSNAIYTWDDDWLRWNISLE